MTFGFKVALPLLILSCAGALAVSDQDFSKAAKSFQRAECEKHFWLKPALPASRNGNFATRFQQEAEEGNVESQASLALCFHIGFGVKRDLAKAIQWYERAANAGHAGATNNLAHLYDSGDGVPLDHAKAHDLYLAAAKEGSDEAQFNVALNYANGTAVAQDWVQAKAWYEKAAAQGNLAATTNLGDIYLLGRGVPVDVDKAIQYLKKPADAGVLVAQCNLAVCYEKQNNYAAAIPLLKHAAGSGYPNAQYALGQVLISGTGVKQDPVEGVKWLRKAAAGYAVSDPKAAGETHSYIAEVLSGDPGQPHGAEAFDEANLAAKMNEGEGQLALGFCYQRGAGVKRDLAVAADYYRRGAELNCVNAATNLGFLLESGRGVAQDYAEAAKWYRIGAEGGNRDACYRLGWLYRAGNGVPQNAKEAGKWLRLAWEKNPNDPGVQRDFQAVAMELAGAVEQGRGLKRDPAEAAVWYRAAAEAGVPAAQFHVGLLYRAGVGVSVDLQEAVKWLRLALEDSPNDPETRSIVAETERMLAGEPAADPLKTPADTIYHRGLEAADGAEIYDRTMAKAMVPIIEAFLLGHPYATVSLANYYRTGRGAPQDVEWADALVSRVEATNDPQLLLMIASGFFTRDGKLAENDFDRVANYLRRAASRGNARSQLILGSIYMFPLRGHQNLVEAYKWLTIAQSHGMDDAKRCLDELVTHLTPAQIDEAKAQIDQAALQPDK